MSKRLYVGNLSFNTTEDQLHELFTANGKVVSTKLISDKFSGRSKGFGFVEMADDAEAEKTISELNGKEVDGRKLTVNEARPMEKRTGNKGRGGGRGFSGGGGGGFKRW